MVVPQHLAEEVQSLGVGKSFVHRVDELLPLLLREVTEDVIEVAIELDLVLLDVLE